MQEGFMRVCLATACFGYKAKMKSTRTAIPSQIRMSAYKKNKERTHRKR